MKCQYCAGEISLEAKYCPYCGKPNEQATEHIRAMEEFTQRYQSTEQEVVTKTKSYAAVTVRAVILAVLIIGIAVTGAITQNAYMIPYNAARRDALKNYEAYREMMLGYLEQGDYSGLCAFVDYHNIPTYDEKYEDMSDVCYAADYYRDSIKALEELVMHGDDEKWLLWNASSDTGQFSRYVHEFYEITEDTSSRRGYEAYTGYIADMRADMDAALFVYLGIDDTEREAVLAMSDNKMSAYLEEAILGGN